MVSLRAQKEIVNSMALFEAVAGVAAMIFPAKKGGTSGGAKPISNEDDLASMANIVNG